MPVENVTANRGYALPNPENDLSVDVYRLIAALEALDVDVHSVLIGLAAKAAATHGHAIADVTGLQAALDAKAASGHTHALGDLSNVSEAGVSDGFVLLRSGGSWVAQQITVSMVSGLQATLTSLQDQINAIDGGSY